MNETEKKFRDLGMTAFKSLSHKLQDELKTENSTDNVVGIDPSIQMVCFPIEYMKYFVNGTMFELLDCFFQNSGDGELVGSLIDDLQDELDFLKKGFLKLGNANHIIDKATDSY